MIENNKSWIARISFFVGTIVLGTEVSRIRYKQLSLELIEKNSFLYESGLVSKQDGLFNFYHLFTNYLPLIVFTITILGIILFCKPNNRKKIIYILLSTSLTLLFILFFSQKYFDWSKSWFFTHQIGILLSYTFATFFIFRHRTNYLTSVYFFLALFFSTFFCQGLQPLIMKLNYGFCTTPYGLTEMIVFFIHIISITTFVLYDKKIIKII